MVYMLVELQNPDPYSTIIFDSRWAAEEYAQKEWGHFWQGYRAIVIPRAINRSIGE